MEMNNEIQPAATDQKIAIYQNASLLKIDEKEQEKLTAAFNDDMIEIRPDGIIYLPQVFWRQRLNEAFGVGQWCLIPKSQNKDPQKDKLYIEGVLMVRGAYMATAVGEAELHSENTMQSWASVWESAKSDCITRCCKDLGIAAELWQPDFNRKWIEKNAVKVFVDTNKGKGEKKIKVQFRKKNTPAFWNEIGIVNDQQPAAAPQAPALKAKINKPKTEGLDEVALDHWTQSISNCKNINDLLDLFNGNKAIVNSEPQVFKMFTERKKQLQK
jgi:hypothetical protein